MSSRIKNSNFKKNNDKVQWPFSSHVESKQYSPIIKPLVKLVGMRGTNFFMKKESPKLDIQSNRRKTRLTINRGTQKIMLDSLSIQQIPEDRRHLSSVNHVCDSCGVNIGSEISRVLILSNIDGGPHLVLLHFFAPCWNLENLLKKYPNFTIEKMSFSFPENMSMSKGSIRKMQTEFDFWV
ncbi:MAG: hypothetical protein ACO2Y0_08020 [Nitrosopumilaceae archaeon]